MYFDRLPCIESQPLCPSLHPSIHTQFVYGIPFSWPPFFLHTYIASVCYSWLALGHSIPRIRRGFGRAMCWIFVGFAVQAFFEARCCGCRQATVTKAASTHTYIHLCCLANILHVFFF